MINKIKLKFGSGSNSNNLEINTTPITIIVGPNNSGKSKLIREIYKWCTTSAGLGTYPDQNKILENIEFTALDKEYSKKALSKRIKKTIPNKGFNDSYIIGDNEDIHVSEDYYLQVLLRPNDLLTDFIPYFLKKETLFLGGEGRMSLVTEQNAGDLQSTPQNNLRVLFDDFQKRKEVRRIIFDAFKKYFVIDPTELGTLKIRLSDLEPESEVQELGIHPEAVQFHAKAKDIKKTGDGIKSFTGIITQLIAGDPSIMLIDEPEAFLHPSLAYKLGKEIALSATKVNKTVIAATHSASFLMGCIQSGVPVNIIRLTYQDNNPTARLLPSENLLKLMRNPLLRSTGTIEGLFYESVVVTESDSDRAFYQEINERLLKYKPNSGIPNCLFINAQNKQTVHQIIRPLRELGIPAATIVDIDILKDGGNNWTNFLKGGCFPEIHRRPLGETRSAINKKFEELNINMKRQDGIFAPGLPLEIFEAAEYLFNQLNEYGLFVVRKGELESWLKHLNVYGHSPKWLIDVFEKMGENPDSDEYLKPSDDDVWNFIETIGKWLLDPRRKGIPTA
ncbi:AAA family ATPase [Niallia taxi]|uniref:ATP-dependent nuclease n=1 Tax=Niallia taxi TaxID=2499688 RepID=UPI002E1C7B94|nr:AAA family ATPase [Niallia taxi]MED4057448.1 AAA family ATPase [Niallia taxi]MED4118059.1 AAA family ATPase [Niallia taxi]